MIAFLIQRSAASDDEWARLIGIQGGLQAAAFAALGALIGVTVQGRAVDAANLQAQTAQGAADQSAAEADGLATELDEKEAALGATAESLTSLERRISDHALPEDVRELPIQIDAVGILPIQQMRGRSIASEDHVLNDIRTLRDKVVAASATRGAARRRARTR